VRLGKPDWSGASHTLAFTLARPQDGELLHVCVNGWEKPLRFQLPPPPEGQCWRRVLDTARTPGEDLRLPPDAPRLAGRSTQVRERSVVLVQALPPGTGPTGL
jgi:glycogen operon protein